MRHLKFKEHSETCYCLAKKLNKIALVIPINKKMDESGIEPETSPMLRERATDYATRPFLLLFVVSQDGIPQHY